MVSLILRLCLWSVTSIQPFHNENKVDTTKELQGYFVFIKSDINEAMIFPDTGKNKKSILSFQNILGYKLPPTDNFDVYKLSKIAKSYTVMLQIKDANDKPTSKKVILSIIKVKIKFTPWNTGMPKSEETWKFEYKKEEIKLKYLVDLDGAIIQAQPIEKKDIKKFKEFKGSPPKHKIF